MDTKCHYRNHDLIRPPQRGHLPVMSGILWTSGQAGNGPHPPFGQLESRVSSLAQNGEMRRWRGTVCLECRTPRLHKGLQRPAASLSVGQCPFVALGVPLLSAGGLCLVGCERGGADARPAPAHERKRRSQVHVVAGVRR